MIVRFEPWGAWVKLESTAAIVALDRQGVRALGLDGGNVWAGAEPSGPAGSSPPRRGPTDNDPAQGHVSLPIEVHLAVTARCGAGCEGCYLDARPDGIEPARATIERELDALRDAGVFTVAFGGGEPTTREDIDLLARAARDRGITPVLTTSGLGLSDARIDKLGDFAQVNVSYDGASGTYEQVRGFDGAAAAERTIARLARAGVRVGVNVVLTRESFVHVRETLERARELGACEAQLLRYKPAGRAATLDYLARRLTPEQSRALGPTLRELARGLCADQRFHVRIDCALVPFLCADDEILANPQYLVRFGVFGCEAAGALSAMTVDGRVAPCSFAPATDLEATALARGYGSAHDLAHWRAYVDSPPEPCASCPLRSPCKGGCKVVASYLDHAHGPDPECPRVQAFRRERSA